MLRLRRPSIPADPGHLTVDVAGVPVAIAIRRRDNARRMTLRVPPGDGPPILTVPKGASLRAAEHFLGKNVAWLTRHLSRRRPSEPFVDGGRLPLRGETRVVHHLPDRRGTVWLAPLGDPAADSDAIGCTDGRDQRAVMLPPPFGPSPTGRVCVAGRPEHLHRRVTDALKSWARQDLTAAVEAFAAEVGRRPASISIRDTRSQWGACTAKGALSFSWRLVLAPPEVLRYVAAHEVAHLVHMNHGCDFWRLNAALTPDLEDARAWLRQHGAALHAVGATPRDASTD